MGEEEGDVPRSRGRTDQWVRVGCPSRRRLVWAVVVAKPGSWLIRLSAYRFLVLFCHLHAEQSRAQAPAQHGEAVRQMCSAGAVLHPAGVRGDAAWHGQADE